MGSMSKVVHESGVIAWAIEIKTLKIAYYGGSKGQ